MPHMCSVGVTAFCLLIGCLNLVWSTTHASDAGISRLTNPDFYTGFEEFYSHAADEEAFIVEYDPWESVNRRTHRFNVQFDERVFVPVVNGYRRVVPGFVRTGIHNFFSNLEEIPVFVSCVLQLKAKKSATTAARFLVNSTIGIAGLFDPASPMGLAAQDEDLGQTLGFYGLGSGPYLVLPILGPSSLRDTVGLVGDFVISREANVLGVAHDQEESIPLFSLNAVRTREKSPLQYGDLSSPFEYQLLRYLYVQSRRLEVLD